MRLDESESVHFMHVQRHTLAWRGPNNDGTMYISEIILKIYSSRKSGI